MEGKEILLQKGPSQDDDCAEQPLAFTGGGEATALVCETDPLLREKILGGLDELGYQVSLAATTREALNALRFHLFEVIVLNEQFDGESVRSNDVLSFLECMAMPTRRRSFVALIGRTERTLDRMAAFRRSVNVVIHVQGIDNLAKIVRQGVAEMRAFYHVFQETLQRLGRV
jgi:CheY-like chemotaxis protein